MRLRKIITAMFFIILLFASSSYAYEYKSEVRVGLKYGSSSGNSFTVFSDAGLNIYNAESGEVLYSAGVMVRKKDSCFTGAAFGAAATGLAATGAG